MTTHNRHLIQQIYTLIEKTCKQSTNYYGYRAWSHHILAVYKFSNLLAKKLGADQEIVSLAALLHDYASVSNKDFYPDHHLHGARLAEDILTQHQYSQGKIEHVKDCILAHRASRDFTPKTLEAKILASADAMAHIDHADSIFYLAYVVHKMDVDQGTQWVLNKLKNSYHKLTPEAKKTIRPKYQAILKAFS